MGSRKTTNAMRPLYACPVIALVFVYWATKEADNHPWLAGILLGFGAIVLLMFFGAYGYFMLKQPHRLQSEWFQIRQLGLELIEAKGSAPVDSNLVELLADPEPPPAKRTLLEGAGPYAQVSPPSPDDGKREKGK